MDTFVLFYFVAHITLIRGFRASFVVFKLKIFVWKFVTGIPFQITNILNDDEFS